MNDNINFFDQLSKCNVWNQHDKKTEQMYNVIWKLMNIDFEKLCNVTKKFPELN